MNFITQQCPLRKLFTELRTGLWWKFSYDDLKKFLDIGLLICKQYIHYKYQLEDDQANLFPSVQKLCTRKLDYVYLMMSFCNSSF